MAPTPSSPSIKHSQRTSSQDSSMDGIRKRVCKACDRCRLKKSKCDGSSPCSRCKADNAICVFGERKKSHDKVYPKGYVEMLEQQQSQLVQGLQELYRRLQTAQGWEGMPLTESNGHPLTHDILAALNLLEAKHDGTGFPGESFEEDVTKLRSRLLPEGHAFTQRRRSFSSESEQSQHGSGRLTAATATPVLSQPNLFRDSFQFDNTGSGRTNSPLVESPRPLQQQQQQQQPQFVPPQQPNLSTNTFQDDPSLYAPAWAQALSDAAKMHTKTQIVPTQTYSPQIADDLDLFNGQWSANTGFDGMFNASTTTNNNNNMMLMMSGLPQPTDICNFQNMAAVDSMDVDFNKFVNPAATAEIYH